jgi:putative endonuclease
VSWWHAWRERRQKEEMPQHLRTGEWGERLAEAELKKMGYRILGRRVRVGRRDELDLIARDGEILVFVEVKTRRNTDYGRPGDAVNRAKRTACSRAAIRYIKRLRKRPEYFRFDVVEVIGLQGAPPREIRHIKNAFPLEGRYRPP